MPDIAYIGGWIEDKQITGYPKRKESVVRVPHYVPDQRAWHVRHRYAGGRCHVVLEIEHRNGRIGVFSTVYVFDAADAAKALGITWTRADLHAFAQLIMSPWDGTAFRAFIVQCNKDRA
jgi:hypothetical protein